MFKYELIKVDKETNARAGILHTDHGDIPTPIFMPVGTVANVKSVHQRELINDVKAKIILGNTYHLYLRPRTEILYKAGGLHKFMGWNKPILTDSGGFQIYSLSNIRKIKEEGVKFQSHIDGSYHFFTPENVIDTQRIIGSDIIMAFDECTPYPCDYSYAKKSLDLTKKWLQRCFVRYNETDPYYGHHQELFPIVQGSVYKDLRSEAVDFASQFQSQGIAIGGLAVGEPKEVMYDMLDHVCDILPNDRARYLMGVGTPENIIESISRGVDMFDCVMPTRNGRNGMLFTHSGIINIKNKKWEDDFSVLDELNPSYASTNYTKAYVRHLFAAHEILGGMITSLNNLSFYLKLVSDAREHIIDGSFKEWKNEILQKVTIRL
ncbi:MAG: tRNA guanosine(34) transglycosylase Tgt [Bacteroidales bacterium]|jgi:queuine tRNA-ribosyltransferase